MGEANYMVRVSKFLVKKIVTPKDSEVTVCLLYIQNQLLQ